MNEAPLASVTCTPAFGDLSIVFEFNASASSDLEDSPEALVVRWDWESDGVWDTPWSKNKVAEHQFASAGAYVVKVEVMDAYAESSIASVEVLVFEIIPEFGSLVAPVVFTVLAVAVASAARARKR
ncbi:MAG: PKD domain-containing protein [Thermoplasmata archaeon]